MESPIDEQKKKRGRKKKSELPAVEVVEECSLPKKRGRKPKGGKLLTKDEVEQTDKNMIANVILHLKCSMDDLLQHTTNLSSHVHDPLIYNPIAPPSVVNYNNDYDNYTVYNSSQTQLNVESTPQFIANNNICGLCKQNMKDKPTNDNDNDINMKDIIEKLKEIKLQLYRSDYSDKKVACFWCTYEYDNPTCFIPKYDMDTVIYGYGSFCRPECAAAYLMKENIDDSVKFERYHLLNQIYGKVYNYKNNIKPAPNPYYLLDKYYGNLTIQEYRKLLKSEHMLLVIDKPMTRILPELHEETESFMNNYNKQPTSANSTRVYKVKRQSEKKKGQSKTDIIKETFGL
jgi:hypothetical protein